MRKLISFMMITLDGFFEGPNHDIEWHNVDEEFKTFAIAQLNSVDMLLFGGGTYRLMAGFWPTAAGIQNDPVTAEAMNRLPKIVFSRILSRVSWQNTRLVKENIVDEVRRLKAEPGKDLLLLASSDLSLTFIQHGLIDEFRIMVNPVMLGSGTSLFQGIKKIFHLRLLKTQIFRSGNVLLSYQPLMKWE